MQQVVQSATVPIMAIFEILIPNMDKKLQYTIKLSRVQKTQINFYNRRYCLILIFLAIWTAHLMFSNVVHNFLGSRVTAPL